MKRELEPKGKQQGAERLAQRGKKTGLTGRELGPRLISFEEIRTPAGKKRKKCPDCRYCQGCSRDRCRLCRAGRRPAGVKLSQAEQIALFEKINRPKRSKPSRLGRR
jgi:hypothetical protein